jgi:uroporphyrin-III C-methyltransferase/precorrin-2 dehydrogenase/sirohydrochlorin ferrochelatase
MQHLPIFLEIRDRLCVIVGAGPIATRKAALLLRAGGRIKAVAPQACAEMRSLSERDEVEFLARAFTERDLEGAHLVIAATDDAAINRRVAALAKAARIPVNVVDDPQVGSFIMPSIIDRSPVIAAVSTGGASPVLARLIRTRLESLIPAGYGHLAALVSRFRDQVKQVFADPADRRRFWDRVLQGGVAERVFSGHLNEAEVQLRQELRDSSASSGVGEVYLVGGGPGDPDLLTFRALRLMQQAEVVVYDRLVAKPVLDMTRRDAQRIYVGKERDRHAMRQEEINRLLADLAKQGKRVVRLKGGDPFIFGRGGEEIDTLAAEGIPFQVIPGITAAAGCAAYSGIPLTHRDYAQSVTFVTGHLKDGSINLNWPQLAQPNQTLVFYMGLHGLPVIREQLIAHGVPGDRPAALIEQGTTQQQRVYTGTLETLPELVERERPKPPTLIIVGEVVKLHDKLSWFKAPVHSEQGATSPVEPGSEL